MNFNYKIFSQGKVAKGFLEANNREEALKQLRKPGVTIINLTSKRDLGNLDWGRISYIDKMFFTEYLVLMLEANTPINEALIILTDQLSGKFKKIVVAISKNIERGNSLADSCASYPKVFSPIYLSLLRIGEASGTLVENLKHLAEQQRKNYNLTKKLQSAMMYPAIILFAAFFVSIALAVFVLPKITKLFSGLKVDLPLMTRILIKFSDVVQKYNYWLIVFFAVLFYLLWLLFRQRFIKPALHTLLLHLPVVKNLSRNSNLAATFLNLGTLLESGLTINESLETIMGVTGNVRYQKFFVQVLADVNHGNTLAASLEKSPLLFPKIACRLIAAGERSGKLVETLKYLANFYERRVDTAIDSLTAIFEPVLLLFLGLVVGSVALAILMPIFQITGSIGGR